MEKEKKRCEWEKFGWISKLRISNHAPSGSPCIFSRCLRVAASGAERVAKIYLNEDYASPPEPR
jgi:hypothetical protein